MKHPEEPSPGLNNSSNTIGHKKPRTSNLPYRTAAMRSTSLGDANKNTGEDKTELELPGFIDSSRDSVMHNLVVCGSRDPNSSIDGAKFSDFMGVSMTLRNLLPNSSGTFISCFPLNKHFDMLESRDPPITDINWGKMEPNSKPWYTYSKAQWKTQQDEWFEFVDEKDLLTRVVKWMHDKASETKPSDTVNLFFQCHGTPYGALCLGTKEFDKVDFTHILRLFDKDVRTNAVGSHCYSGQLSQAISADGQLDRYISSSCGPNALHFTASRSVSSRLRGLSFSQYFIQSVARPDLSDQGEESVKAHGQFMTDVMRNIIPQNAGVEPSTYLSYLSSEKITGLILLEDLLVREYADVTYDRESNYKRQRAEWPGVDHLTLFNRS